MFTKMNDDNTTNSQKANSQDKEFTGSEFTTTRQVFVNLRPVNLQIPHE